MTLKLSVIAYTLLLLLVGCAQNNMSIFVRNDQETIEVHLNSKEVNNVLSIAHKAFGRNIPYNMAIINASDIVGSTKKAVSKIGLSKESWVDYNMKAGSRVYYYTQIESEQAAPSNR